MLLVRSLHTGPEIIRAAIDSNIIILKFPLNVTDVLQPLDVTCFGPLKKKWSALLSARSGIEGNRCYLSKCNFVDELAGATACQSQM